MAAVSSTSGDLRFLDTDLWANTLVELSNHKLPVVRRNIVPSLRDYFETFPEDERQLLPTLWQDGDEVVRTRMRELLSRMEEVSPKQFSNRITDLVSNGCDLQPLWELLDARKADASNGWKRWLAGEGDLPEVEQKPHHISDMEAPDELPELDDALETLDQELGFLD